MAYIPPIGSIYMYIPLIYHLYIAFWGVLCYPPPFLGTRNNHRLYVLKDLFFPL